MTNWNLYRKKCHSFEQKKQDFRLGDFSEKKSSFVANEIKIITWYDVIFLESKLTTSINNHVYRIINKTK